MNRFTLALAGCIAMNACIALEAGADVPRPATAPAGQAAAVKPDAVGKLIHDLGDEDIDVVDAASKSLSALGMAALPQLKAARTDANPKIAAWAKAIADEIIRKNPPKIWRTNPASIAGLILMDASGKPVVQISPEGLVFIDKDGNVSQETAFKEKAAEGEE